jgi:hypothetical protein
MIKEYIESIDNIIKNGHKLLIKKRSILLPEKYNKIRIYIASPYSNGDTLENVNRQLDMSHTLLQLGFAPYTPLLTHFQQLRWNMHEELIMDLDINYLLLCHALLRLKPLDKNGIEIPSKGADLEEEMAKLHNIPVFYNLEDLCTYFNIEVKNI